MLRQCPSVSPPPVTVVTCVRVSDEKEFIPQKLIPLSEWNQGYRLVSSAVSCLASKRLKLLPVQFWGVKLVKNSQTVQDRRETSMEAERQIYVMLSFAGIIPNLWLLKLDLGFYNYSFYYSELLPRKSSLCILRKTRKIFYLSNLNYVL